MEEVAVMVMAAVAAKMIAKLNRLFGLPGIARRRAYVLAMLFFYMSPLSFDNGWTDRNADCCIKTVN